MMMPFRSTISTRMRLHFNQVILKFSSVHHQRTSNFMGPSTCNCFMNRTTVLVLFCVLTSFSKAQRCEKSLTNGWRFYRGDVINAEKYDYDDTKWEKVTVPHDWAIFGPFDRNNDLQNVQITQDMEKVSSIKTGRTGGLPYFGTGWYRIHFKANAGNITTILFDGAMSDAHVFVNGNKVGFWHYGYNSFYFDITKFVNNHKNNNVLAVKVENLPLSSRWYPGAGLFRNVHLITTNKTHIPVWGTYITTPHISDKYASVRLQTYINNAQKDSTHIETDIISPNGNIVATKHNSLNITNREDVVQNFIIDEPLLWSPESPYLYYAKTRIYQKDKLIDVHTTRFGIRNIEYVADKGMLLNGDNIKIHGVCIHHDLGPLGTAINISAIRHRLLMLKDMGCNAIRTTHNMPSPELVNLCDEMGFMLLVESFDEWNEAKCVNGYHRIFNDWFERDLKNMILHFRNNPSVIMWGIGNEIPNQCDSAGYKMVNKIQDICHKIDPSRPVTCCMDNVPEILNNGFASFLDIPGLNYRTEYCERAYNELPNGFVLGSETASTVSSRGVYKFPVELKKNAKYSDHQSSGYDTECCIWSNLPDVDFALEDKPWYLGQFVWTGFDYLGEPTPYNNDSWPSHSSLFGIIDLASLPKDRYYLYRSVWNKHSHTLHILPHWNWNGKEGMNMPVFVYTDYPSAELFINGKSYGRRNKITKEEFNSSANDLSLLKRYRLIWENVTYEPGEIKVVAYNSKGEITEIKTLCTAGKASRIKMETDKNGISAANGELTFITVKIVDDKNNLCPDESRLIRFNIHGAAIFRAVANGDPTSLELFHKPEMHTFHGEMTLIIESIGKSGKITVKAENGNIGKTELTLYAK